MNSPRLGFHLNSADSHKPLVTKSSDTFRRRVAAIQKNSIKTWQRSLAKYGRNAHAIKFYHIRTRREMTSIRHKG